MLHLHIILQISTKFQTQLKSHPLAQYTAIGAKSYLSIDITVLPLGCRNSKLIHFSLKIAKHKDYSPPLSKSKKVGI